jgi:hypothetical protein
MKPTQSDLEKAKEIVRLHRAAGKSFVGGMSIDLRVARLIAKGIALGRKEALEAAGKGGKADD